MTDEKLVSVGDWLRGGAKSKLVWLGTLLTILSTVAANFEAWQPLFGSAGPLVGQLLGVAIVLLRAITTTPLPHK